MEAKDWVTLLAALGALVFSLLNYKRSRRFENENQLFKLKLESYQKLLVALNKLSNAYQDLFGHVTVYVEQPDETLEDEIDKLTEAAEDAAMEFIDFRVEHSLAISAPVMKLLDEINIYLSESKTMEDTDISKVFVKAIDAEISFIHAKADKINNSIREDLHINQLNTLLMKRLK